MAPPLTLRKHTVSDAVQEAKVRGNAYLTFSKSNPSFSTQYTYIVAKASLISHRSTWSLVKPAFSRTLLIASTGPMPFTNNCQSSAEVKTEEAWRMPTMYLGVTPTTLVAICRARGFKPSSSALRLVIMKAAAAPSVT